MPKISQNELQQKDKLVVRTTNNNHVENVIFPNGLQVGLEIEGFNHGLKLPNLFESPAKTTNLLYAAEGVIYFNGPMDSSSTVGVARDDAGGIIAGQVFG